jgi:Mlc titration factor MtfA (ptsG expression regulator)
MVGLFLLFLVIALVLVFFYLTVWRNRLIRNRPLPPQWLAIIQRSVPVYSSFSGAEQKRLQQLIRLFLASKKFYGCGGLVMTDEIRVTIAAQACLLLLHQGWSVYPDLFSILVYPDAFQTQRNEHREDGTVISEHRELLGESWSNGKVILSWDDVTRGIADFSDGRNVVLHEFAHQLDSATGSTNGAPALRTTSYATWSRVLGENFDDLRWRSLRGEPIVLDSYGATNPAEFFAVATEAFFERPAALAAHRPELYQELSAYYRVDPRAWHGHPIPRGNSGA